MLLITSMNVAAQAATPDYQPLLEITRLSQCGKMLARLFATFDTDNTGASPPAVSA